MNIYELNYQFNQIALMADDPEVSNDDLLAALSEANSNLEEFVDNGAKTIANINGDIEGIKSEIDRLTARYRTLESRVAAIKVAMKQAMDLANTRKIKTGIFDVSIAKNGGKAPVILTCTPDQLPDGLVRIKREADNDKIRKYIEETGDVAYGYIGERGESLRIR